MKARKFLIIGIILVAGFLRFWKISQVPVSLFSDELDVGYQAYSVIETGKDYFGNPHPLQFESYADTRTPLYIYSAVPSVFLFGITPLGVRLPAALFGVFGVLGIYLLAGEMFKEIDRISVLGLELSVGEIAAFALAISPWHIQYSRAAFEATMLLAFILFGLYFFFKSLGNSSYLWISVLLLVFTPWIYNTAKLFTPILLVSLLLIWRKEVSAMKRPYLVKALLTGLVIGLPLIFITFFGGGIRRAGYLSVFTDPTTKSEVDYSILYDAQVRKVYGGGIASKIFARVVHNKFTFWGSKIVSNYISSLSFDFLFLKGDINLRQSIDGMGEFYKLEIIPLILGIIFFFSGFKNRKVKLLIFIWVFAGILPAAITRDGGNHATRLILILPPLIFLISNGLVKGFYLLRKGWRGIFAVSYLAIWILSFGFYQHLYWVHNPWYSERSWNAGYKEVIEAVKNYESKYKKIIITNTNDDPRIFLASYYPINPVDWQKGLEKEIVPGFGEIQHFDKYYFGQVDGTIGVYKLSDYLDSHTLYIASAREVKDNLIMDPQKTPEGLKIIKAIPYPSGEPAFYFFEKS
jgi:4-amino-4-deoxy-L-arabinose transferase-like glycosyltransferase